MRDAGGQGAGESPVSWSIDDAGVAILLLSDAENCNALSETLAGGLRDALQVLAGREDVRTVVLAGLPEWFSAGASQDVLVALAEQRIVPGDIDLPRAILDFPVPTIAAMEGHAIGGGLALGVCTDIVLIARESRYGCTFMNMGFTPGMGTTRLLEHVMAPARAHEMLYTGQTFRGAELIGTSSFNYVLPRTDVLPKALDLAARIAEKPRCALVELKQALSRTRKRIYEAAFEQEIAMHRVSFDQPDIAAMIRAWSW
jgi:polyketide biosynthesis enoyl-CoA hydratase PksI